MKKNRGNEHRSKAQRAALAKLVAAHDQRVVVTIRAYRERQYSYRQIAEHLEEIGLPTPAAARKEAAGYPVGAWSAETVRRIAKRQGID